MTISQEACVTEVMLGDDLTTVWPFDFLIPTEDDVSVWLVEQETGEYTLVPPSAYTVTNEGVASGGSITYPLGSTPLSSDWGIIIARNVPYAQGLNIGPQGSWSPASLMSALDNIVMQTQQNRRDINRAWLTPLDDVGGALPRLEGGHFPIMGSDGNWTDGGTALISTTGSSDRFVSPRAYGAVGDGTTDDSAALESCLAYCVASNSIMFIDGYFLHVGEFVIDDPIMIKGIGKTKCGIKTRTDAEHAGVLISNNCSNSVFEDLDLEVWSSATIANGQGHNATCATLGVWFTAPADPEAPLLRNVTFNRVRFFRTAGSGAGHAVACMARVSHIYMNDCEWDGDANHGNAWLAHWGAWSDGVTTTFENPPLTQSKFEPGHYSHHPNNIYVKNARVRKCGRLCALSSTYDVFVSNVEMEMASTHNAGQLIDLPCGDEADTFAHPDDRGKVYRNFHFKNINLIGFKGSGANGVTVIDCSGLSTSKQTATDLAAYAGVAYVNDHYNVAQKRVRQPTWGEITFENITFDGRGANVAGSSVVDQLIYMRNLIAYVTFRNVRIQPSLYGIKAAKIANCRGQYLFENCYLGGGLSLDRVDGFQSIGTSIVLPRLPVISVPITYVLAFDAQTANFTVGQVVTGTSSQAQGTIASQSDAGTTGTLTLTSVSGVFRDNEPLTDPLGGAATANIPTAFRFGDSLTGGTSTLKGQIVELTSSAVLQVQLTNGYGDFDVGETITAVRVDGTAGGSAVVGATSQTGVSNFCTEVSGERYTYYLGSNLAKNATTVTIAATLPFDAQTVNYTVGQTATGATSLASAVIVFVEDAGATGVLHLGPITGKFRDNELVTDGLGGSATSNIPTNVTIAYAVNFDAQGSNFVLDGTITGATSLATGTLKAQDDSGTSGVLVLESVTGTFQDNEVLTGSSGGSALSNIPSGVTELRGIQFDGQGVSGTNFTAGSNLTGARSSIVAPLIAIRDNGATGTCYVTASALGADLYIDNETLYDDFDGSAYANITGAQGVRGFTTRVKVGDRLSYSGGVLTATDNAELNEFTIKIEPAPAAATATSSVAFTLDEQTQNAAFINTKVIGGSRGYNIDEAVVNVIGGSVRGCGQYGLNSDDDSEVFVYGTQFSNNGLRRLLPDESALSTRDIVADHSTINIRSTRHTDAVNLSAYVVITVDCKGGSMKDCVLYGNPSGTDMSATNPQTGGGWFEFDNNRMGDTGIVNLYGRRYGSATFNPSNLADGAGETTTVTVTDAALGDFAEASFSLDLQGITLTAWVSAANTVSVRFQNESGGPLDLASGTLKASAIRRA